VQRFSDDPLTECPECSATIRRVIQPVGVVFKGSGWYITDSRPKSSGDGADGAAKPKSSEKTDASAKSEKSDTSDKTEKTAKPAAEKSAAGVAG
jgi:predicted nucleic acid-binding Zn ribbon protein